MAPASMSTGDATTIPLRDGSPEGFARRLTHRLRVGRASAATDANTGVQAGALALGAIVLLSLMVVLLAANRPSLLAPTTHYGFYPQWMAGPLGGLLPWLTQNSTVLKYLFTGSLLMMYGCYVVVLRSAPRMPARWVDRGDPGCARDLRALAAAGPHRPLQLHQLRADGGGAQPQPLHNHPDLRAPQRSELHPQQLARAAEPLRAAVHPADIRRGAARRGGVLLGAEGDPRAGQPGDDLPGVALRADAGARSPQRDRPGGAEPDSAGVGAGGRPQRLPDGGVHHARLLSPAAWTGERGRGGSGVEPHVASGDGCCHSPPPT